MAPSERPALQAQLRDGALKVNRADYGLTWNFIGIAAMDSAIAVHAVFTRQ